MSCLSSTATDVREPMAQCVFCGASSEKGFNIVFEDKDYIAFKDRSPAAEHHLLVIPRIHVGAVQKLLRKSRGRMTRIMAHHTATVKVLDQVDIPMLMTMKEIGTRIFDDLGVLPEKRRMGFHIPPFNSVNHLHLHLHALPYRGVLKLEFPVSKGKNNKSKGFSWFVEVDQAVEILRQGKAIGVFPC